MGLTVRHRTGDAEREFDAARDPRAVGRARADSAEGVPGELSAAAAHDLGSSEARPAPMRRVEGSPFLRAANGPRAIAPGCHTAVMPGG